VWVVVLSTITVGVYAWFWWYFINRELRDLGSARGSAELGDNPTVSALAVSLGSLILVPPFVSLANGTKRIEAAQRISGEREPINGWIVLVLTVLWVFGITLFIPLVFGYIQSELNKVWRNPQLTEPLNPALPHPGAQPPVYATEAHTTATAAQLPDADAAAQPAPATTPTQAAADAASGWYPDPWSQSRLRYWDGQAWTGHTAD